MCGWGPAQQSSWMDGCKSCAVAQGGAEPDPTCFVRSTSAGSRIDAAFANATAANLIGEAGFISDSALPTHSPVALELVLGDCSHQVMSVKRPMRIPLSFVDPDPDAETLVANRVCGEVLVASSVDWVMSLASRNLENCCLFGATMPKITCANVPSLLIWSSTTNVVVAGGMCILSNSKSVCQPTVTAAFEQLRPVNSVNCVAAWLTYCDR